MRFSFSMHALVVEACYYTAASHGVQSKTRSCPAGIHYDALARKLADGSAAGIESVFLPTDAAAMTEALAVAAELKASRSFVDVANFTLMCMVCSKGLKGAPEAQAHARETGHANFCEYRK